MSDHVELEEMYRTFNMGVGMVLVVSKDELEKSITLLNEAGENAWHIGEITTADGDQQVSFI